MPAISVQGLTKTFRTYKKQPGFVGAVKGLFHRRYEQTVAVRDVTFTVEEGELVGFLGPNGAGKPPLLKCSPGFSTQQAGPPACSVIHRWSVTMDIGGNLLCSSAKRTSFGGTFPPASR